MNYGVQLSTSGVLTALYRQDVLANNLANMDTVGFKPEVASARQRLAARQEDHLPQLPSDGLLERLGAGVLMAPNRLDMGQGGLRRTDQALDVGIKGEGFLRVQAEPRGQSDRVYLTRDGRLALDLRGRLVTQAEGYAVLDATGAPITVNPAEPVTIRTDGAVMQSNTVIATLALHRPVSAEQLRKAGQSLFVTGPEALDTGRADGLIQQGHLEESGVDEMRTLMQLQSAARDVDANIALIQQQDRLMDRAINTFGRLA